MKAFRTIVLMSLISGSAMAFQTPLQQTGGVVNAVVKAVLADQMLQFLSIKKILVVNNVVKVGLASDTGACITVPYSVTYDYQGFPVTNLDINGIAAGCQ